MILMMRNLLFSLYVIVLIVSATWGFAADNTPVSGLLDIKGPVYFPSNHILLIILILALIAVGFFALVRFLRAKNKRVEVATVDPRMPWEIATERFDKLESSSLLEEGDFKSYYSVLSGIIRQYFEDRFKVRAPEMTTEEFLWSLEKSRYLTADQNDTLKQFLNSCDIVKFAKYIPRIQEGKESIQLARRLVEETKVIDSETSSVSGKSL